ncbi:MAG: dienelactone hydrolase family protein [Acidimicrobiales bacterium]
MDGSPPARCCRRRPAHRRRRFLDGCVDGVLAGGAGTRRGQDRRHVLRAQSIDFDQADATFQGHFADDDHLVSEEDRVTTEAFIRLGDNDTDFHLYPDTQHWFFESGDTFDPAAAELAWDRMMAFLAEHHPVNGSGR